MQNKKDIITKEMQIDYVIRNYPLSTEIFLAYGLHCIGCSLAGWETIEQGAKVHGFDNKMLNEMIKDVNNEIANQEKFEDNAKVKITKRATHQVAILMKKSKGSKYLRIAIINTPYGIRYGFKFSKRKKKTDTLIEKDVVMFIIDKKSIKQLIGSTMDYLSILPGNGFKIFQVNKN